MKFNYTILCFLLTFTAVALYSQDSISNDIATKLSIDLPVSISKKTDKLSEQIGTKSEKVLRSMQKAEQKLKRKLERIDSLAAVTFFTDAKARYSKLLEDIQQKTGKITAHYGGEYLPYLDSLKGGLGFLQQNVSLTSLKKNIPGSIAESLEKIKCFESKLQEADNIKQFISQRKQQLKELLNRYTSLPKSLGRNLTTINKKIYYYSAQIREYREMFRDPDKMEQKALALLNKLPAFKQFMKEHSQLSGLLNIQGSSASSASLTGLQPRDRVVEFLQTQVGAGGGMGAESLLRNNLQSSQGQIDQIRNKLNALRISGGDLDMPDFKPNNQKTKTFFQRLEYGTNLQTAHGSSYFPVTTDIGLSLGYKMSDRNIIGIGASYKIGWGKDIRHINISSQGAGFRSFLDINIKKTFFVSGGFEYNYQQPFNSVNILYQLNSWQQSGLIGMSKIIPMKTKIFKKTKIQLLWDFLSYQQRPQTQSLKFRVGFNF